MEQLQARIAELIAALGRVAAALEALGDAAAQPPAPTPEPEPAPTPAPGPAPAPEPAPGPAPSPEPEPAPTPPPTPAPDPTPAPTPDPDPAPVPVPVPAAPIWDLIGQPVLSIPSSIEVPAGQREIFIPVSIDRDVRESFYCYVDRMVNVSGGNINVGNHQQSRDLFAGLDVPYRWSPGDDRAHYIKLVTKNAYPAGRAVQASIRCKGLGDGQKGRGVTIRFVDGASHPDMPAQHHRPLRRLDLSGADRANRFEPSSIAWSPNGFKDGRPCLMSALSHGRTQDGNQETGLYADETIPGAVRPISYDPAAAAIRLHTRAFPPEQRLEYQKRLFAHQAAVIQGLHVDELCGADGCWRMVARIPSRRYSWPAFWLVNRVWNVTAKKWENRWPGEIDILEKFNHVWGGADTRYTTSFAQHFGPLGAWDKKKGAFGSEVEVDQWGLSTRPIDEDYHSWACVVKYDENDTTKSEVTFFFDDVEVGCHILFARHQDLNRKVEFYPIANVAVKAPETYTADEYNADAGRHLSGDMLIRDIGYYPRGIAFADV